MNTESRTKNSLRNLLTGVVGQVITVLLNFISRTIFIKFLNIEYLGLNGLFTNIITILSLAELGVGGAIVYSMYKPIAENDRDTLKALMKLYSKIYMTIGIVIAVLGVAIIPFLDVFIKNTPKNINNLSIIYCIFLLNTVMSYFFSYKRSIITADQREYICTLYRFIFNIIKFVLQIIILIITQNFILYLIIQVLCTLMENVAISIKADKLYPFLKEKDDIKLKKSDKVKIFTNIKALMIYKICSTMLDGTDNLIISSFIGVVWVGLLSNYTLVIGAVSLVLTQIISAITASIGNVVSVESKEKQEEIFYNMFFISFLLYGFSSICLIILINPFISLWLGKDYILSELKVFIIVLNFYIYGMQNVVWTYRSTMGLFIYGKFRPLVSGIMNIVLSIILCKYLGLLGVLLGTTITRLATNVWYDPIIIFKYGFKKSVKLYYLKYLQYIFIFLTMSILLKIFNYIIDGDGIIYFVILLLTTCLALIISFFIIFRKNKEFKYLEEKISNIIKHYKMRDEKCKL